MAGSPSRIIRFTCSRPVMTRADGTPARKTRGPVPAILGLSTPQLISTFTTTALC